jgi:predicted PurR-regulated permease PerM
MFTLPSVWNVLISTIVFIVAAWYIRRFLEEQGIPKGFARSIAIFVLAYAMSWFSGEAVDYIQEKIEGPKAATQLDLGMPIDL